MQGSQCVCVGDELLGVKGAFSLKEEGAGWGCAGLVVDDPQIIRAFLERGWAGAEDAVCAQGAEAVVAWRKAGRKARPGGFGLRFGVGREDPAADGVAGAGEQQICHSVGC